MSVQHTTPTETNSLQRHDFETAVKMGETVDKSGYHQPRGGRRSPRCGCHLTTDKGAYRDVTVDAGGVTIHFYHQSSVVVRSGSKYRLDSHGYHTRTTKERMSGYLPNGYSVIQRDYDWYVVTPEGRVPFRDGMVIDTSE